MRLDFAPTICLWRASSPYMRGQMTTVARYLCVCWSSFDSFNLPMMNRKAMIHLKCSYKSNSASVCPCANTVQLFTANELRPEYRKATMVWLKESKRRDDNNPDNKLPGYPTRAPRSEFILQVWETIIEMLPPPAAAPKQQHITTY